MSEKNLKQQIHAGETLVGVPISLQSNRDDFDSLLEHGPYDFVCADAQHSAYNEERLVEFCNLADEFDIPVMFRIKHTRQTYMLGNYLDLGPSGIEVPQVELESTAEEAAAAFYYPSAGIRSWGGNNRKGWTNGRDRLEYAGWWDQFGVLMLQLESVDAVQNARNLAKPGVDLFSFGPIDLTFDIESYPNSPFESVDDCVRHVVAQVAHLDVFVCHRIGDRENREKYAEMGVTVFLELLPV